MYSITIEQACNAIGVFGFGFYILAYAALTMRWVTSHSLSYFSLNLLAAICMLISLTVSFNLGSLLIQLFWIAISLIGIFVVIRETMSRPKHPTNERSVAHVSKQEFRTQRSNFFPQR